MRLRGLGCWRIAGTVAVACLLAGCAAIPQQGRQASLRESSGVVVVNDFEDPGDRARITLAGGFVDASLTTEPAFVRSGLSSLALEVHEGVLPGLEGKPTPRVIVPVDAGIHLRDFRALAFDVFVPEDLTRHFFGRRDVFVKLNEARYLSSADPSTRGEIHWAAIQPGWNHYEWDFGDFETFEVLRDIEIQFGPLLEGYGAGRFYLDSVRLLPADRPVDGTAGLEEVLESPSWSYRYHAIEEFEVLPDEEAIQALMAFAGDSSRAVRNRAVEAMAGISGTLDEEGWTAFLAGLDDPNWRVRMSVYRLLAGARPGPGTSRILREGLLDENYTIRDFCRERLLAAGPSHDEIANQLLEETERSGGRATAALRALAEMRARSGIALPGVVGVLRDASRPMRERQWALRAAWEIDEAVLLPSDWVIGLDLDPGDIHRHLLNRTMQRLEEAGNPAVPVLVEALGSADPNVRSRACVVLALIGGEASPALEELRGLLDDGEWHVAWEAAQAIKAITGEEVEPGEVKQAPGEGESGSSEPVSVVRQGGETTFGNGLVEIVFRAGDDAPGPSVVRFPGGGNLADASWLPNILAFRYSNAPAMVERQWLQRLFGSPFPRRMEAEVVSETPEAAHYVFSFVPQDDEPIAWEFHYMLRRGDPGFYTWINARNVSGRSISGSDLLTAEVGIGRLTHLVGLTWGLWDFVYLDDRLKGPASYTEHPSEAFAERWPDIYQSVFRTPSGELFAKHEWENYHYVSHVNGYAGKSGGFWMIYPSLDFFGDSMPRHQATSTWGNVFVPHWEGKYHSNVTAFMSSDWRKTYGPVFVYLNRDGSPEAMWTDAKRRSREEQEKWPYDWMHVPGFQDRGHVAGLAVDDAGVPLEGGYAILSNPNYPADPGQVSLWMRNTGPYQYWTGIDSGGRFGIDHVRAGKYELFVFQPGIHGETRAGIIHVDGGKTTDAGTIVLEPVRHGTTLWQIGVPDGGAMEFRNGRGYHQWDTYTRYREDFPGGVRYVVGESDWRRDWNYIHPMAVQGEEEPVNWRILFELQQPPAGEYMLTIVAGGRNATVGVVVNGREIGVLEPKVGWHHIRTCPIGEQAVREYTIPAAMLQSGWNEITLSAPAFDPEEDRQRDLHFQQWTRWIAYDFVRFEKLPE